MNEIYRILLTKEAIKDVKKLSPKLKEKCKKILYEILSVDPYRGKKLIGNLIGLRSIRLSYQDRIVYRIDEHDIQVIIIRAKTHYGE